jgi:hypothetical protein
MLLPASLLIAGGLGSGIFMQFQNSQASQQRVADSVRVFNDSVAAAEAARSKGRAVITGLPEGVKVLLNRSLYGNGDVFYADSGIYIGTATAPGYVQLNQQVTIVAGRTDTVRLAMTSMSAQQLGGGPSRQTNLRAPADSGEFRTAVSPIHGQIFVDGTQIGTGRVGKKLPVGQHTVQYRAPGCETFETTVTIVRNDMTIIPLQTLVNCK